MDPANDKQLLNQKNQLEKEISETTKAIEQFYSGVSYSDFTFSNPGQGFSESHVKGYIAKFVNIPEKYQEWGNALEICAGGKLYHVMVENERDATLLLERGKLKKRVTIIPLNKIQSFTLSKEVRNKWNLQKS